MLRGPALPVSLQVCENSGPALRPQLLHPMISSQRLDLRPIVKYAALTFFAGRFLPALPRFSNIHPFFSGGRWF